MTTQEKLLDLLTRDPERFLSGEDAAARLGVPLVEWDEQLHVLPAVHRLEAELEQPGNYVLMKSASRMAAVKELLRRSGRAVRMVENCCMDGEKRYYSVDEIPDDAGYFSLIIAKERGDK